MFSLRTSRFLQLEQSYQHTAINVSALTSIEPKKCEDKRAKQKVEHVAIDIHDV